MNRRLYQLHDSPLHFWMEPEEVEIYNQYYVELHKGFVSYELLNAATKIDRRILPRMVHAHKKGLVDINKIDRRVPLTIAH